MLITCKCCKKQTIEYKQFTWLCAKCYAFIEHKKKQREITYKPRNRLYA